MNLSSTPQAKLSELLAFGASIEIAVGNRAVAELMMLAGQARAGGGQLILKETCNLNHQGFLSLSAYGKGHILFKD